jgi:hypothetical protein
MVKSLPVHAPHEHATKPGNDITSLFKASMYLIPLTQCNSSIFSRPSINYAESPAYTSIMQELHCFCIKKRAPGEVTTMAFYHYEARNIEQKAIVRESIEADNLKDAMAKLRDMGLVVLHIEQSFTKPGEVPLQAEKGLIDKVKDFFYRLMGDLKDL